MENNASYGVVIPLYNSEEFILDSIASVLRQTIQPDKVTIIDDCSSDSGREVVREYLRDFCKVQPDIDIICLDINSGSASKPRNVGISSIGKSVDYVAFLDADDIWHPQKMEFQISSMIREKLNVSASEVWKFEVSNTVESWLTTNLGLPDSERSIEEISLKNFKYNNPIKSCSTLVANTDLDILFPENPAYRSLEDYYAWIELFLRNDFVKFGIIEEKLTGYRSHDESLSSSKTAMSLRRMRNFYYKRELFSRAGMRLSNTVVSEIRYIFSQLK